MSDDNLLLVWPNLTFLIYSLTIPVKRPADGQVLAGKAKFGGIYHPSGSFNIHNMRFCLGVGILPIANVIL